jgi:hypothetical protein
MQSILSKVPSRKAARGVWAALLLACCMQEEMCNTGAKSLIRCGFSLRAFEKSFQKLTLSTRRPACSRYLPESLPIRAAGLEASGTNGYGPLAAPTRLAAPRRKALHQPLKSMICKLASTLQSCDNCANGHTFFVFSDL